MKIHMAFFHQQGRPLQDGVFYHEGLINLNCVDCETPLSPSPQGLQPFPIPHLTVIDTCPTCGSGHLFHFTCTPMQSRTLAEWYSVNREMVQHILEGGEIN